MWFSISFLLYWFFSSIVGIYPFHSLNWICKRNKFSWKKGQTIKRDLIIIDGAPGIGCPVISSLTGVDYTLIVTEPTISGISDFKRVFEVAKFLNIKTLVCVNKYDLNLDNTKKIDEFCAKNRVERVGNIPYDEEVSAYLSRKKFIIDATISKAGKEIINLWETLSSYLYSN